MAADNTVDLIVNQKSSFEVSFDVQHANGSALNLTGYSVTSKLKPDFQSPDNSAISMTTAVSNAVGGVVTISMSPTVTAALQPLKYVYDVTITDDVSGFKTRIVEGFVRISGGVS